MQITTKLDKAKIQQHLDHVLNNALTHIVENLVQYKLNKNLPEVEDYQSMHDWFSFDEEKLGKALEEKVCSLVNFMPRGPFNYNDPFGHNLPGLVAPMNPSWPPQPQPRFQSMAPAHGQMPMGDNWFSGRGPMHQDTSSLQEEGASLFNHASNRNARPLNKYQNHKLEPVTVNIYLKDGYTLNPFIQSSLRNICQTIDPFASYSLASSEINGAPISFPFQLLKVTVAKTEGELKKDYYVLVSSIENTYIVGATEEEVFQKGRVGKGPVQFIFGDSRHEITI